jgi:uncharacterized protein YndB with AHSA1/START domain
VISGDSASASVHVRVAQDDAFDVFTREIDQWWRTGPRYRIGGKKRGLLFFEGGLGGRLFETFEVASGGTRTFEVGKVTAWDPPRRIELEWRNVNFKPGESTFVEVTFEPMGEGTMVTVRHRGFAALPAGHPVRHGLEGAAFARMIGMWWGELMTSLREHVDARGIPSA